MITVTSRERPASRDPFELNHRNADLAVMEHRAKRLHLGHDTWGEFGARRIKIEARGAKEVGTLLRFLVEAHQSYQTCSLRVEVEDDTERELVRGIGLPDYVFLEELP